MSDATKMTSPCPRRVEGPFTYNTGEDTWRLNSWEEFPHPWQPRTCSYCGGVHPEDAIRLLEEGWQFDMTSKSYKVYLEPADPPDGGKRIYVTPPVKVYRQHFSEEQNHRLSALLLEGWPAYLKRLGIDPNKPKPKPPKSWLDELAERLFSAMEDNAAAMRRPGIIV